MKRISTVLVFTLAGVTGCSAPIQKPVHISDPDPIPKTQEAAPLTSNYVSITTPKKQIMDKRITINSPSISLMDALTQPRALNNVNIIAMDTGVLLSRHIGVKAEHVSLSDYIRQIEGSTDYQITLKDRDNQPVMEISSSETKSWDLATLSDMPTAISRAGFTATSNSNNSSINTTSSTTNTSNTSSGSRLSDSASGTQVTITRDDKVWQGLINDAKTILDIKDDKKDSKNTDNSSSADLSNAKNEHDLMSQLNAMTDANQIAKESVKPWVVGNKRLGKIIAHGKPSQIARLDQYFSKLQADSQRQFHLQAAILNVTSKNGDSQGIDWSVLYKNGDGTRSASLSGASTQALSLVDGGTWSLAATIPFGDLTLKTLMQELRSQGSVSLQSQPRVTVTNGYTALLGSTQEFSYVSGVQFLPLSTGSSNISSDTAITTTLSRVNVGIKIAVTPKLLDNGKIMLNIVPILSSVVGTTAVQSAGSVFETPNIALQELSTQVITTSGTPVYLGGLIMNKILQDARKLPLKNKALADALGSAKMESEDSELLIVITPQEVGA